MLKASCYLRKDNEFEFLLNRIAIFDLNQP